MIGYISVGTNDLERSGAFYDELFEIIDAKRTYEFEDFIVWGTNESDSMFSVHIPYDGKSATVGNGVMIALKADSKEIVDKFYAKAIALNATDEGKPGSRMEGFYAAYFRDLDGNKLNIHFMDQ